MSIASLESLYGRKAFYPFLEAGAVDVAIIDATWNGVWESAKIAALCDMYDVNVRSNLQQQHHHRTHSAPTSLSDRLNRLVCRLLRTTSRGTSAL